LLDDLTQKAFGGSAMKLLQRMVSARRVSAEELAEIQRLIEQARGAAP
jgi:predicted transcriptional regulator